MHFDQIKRREFITLLGGATACPLSARAQQGERMRLIGVLMAYAENNSEAQAWVAAFQEGVSRSSGGPKAATSGSIIAGRRWMRS